ncbi:MAG: hypothetical protein LBT07_00785 [Endomicrobium sp.]|jgi:putative transposase|nr:hypothetical protein [Endomicrobium sp.]
MEFVVQDVLLNGRKFKVLTVIDIYYHRCSAFEVDTSINGARVVSVLDRLKDYDTLPETITVDNCPEFSVKTLSQWANVKLHFIEPGKLV